MKVTFCSNIGSPDLTSLVDLQPSTFWSHVDAFQLYSQHILVDEVGRDFVGINTFDQIRGSGLLTRLVDLEVPLVVEAGVVKEWDCAGERLLALFDRIHTRVLGAGGILSAISMDEPLTAGVKGQFDRPTCYGIDRVHTVAQATARYVKHARGSGVECILTEAWPQHPVDRILAFVKHVQMDEGAPIHRFILDIDPYAIGAESPNAREDAILEIKAALVHMGIPFGLIVTGHRILSQADYMLKARQSFREICELKPFPDWLVVQSWQRFNGEKHLPLNFPPHEKYSHVGLLSEISETIAARER